MTFSPCASARVLIAAMLACAIDVGAYAQQTPITGQMLAPAAPPAAAESAAPPAAASPLAAADESTRSDTNVGDTTRRLLSLQAQGTHAGKQLPIPGQQASASYQRYLKSFEHPIPEFYDAAVSKNASASSTSDSP